MNNPVQPAWLRKCVSGLDTAGKYYVHLEGKKYAIIFRPGYTGYVNRMDRNKYCPCEYTLVEKGKNFWLDTWETVHRGRLKKVDRLILMRILTKKEREVKL